MVKSESAQCGALAITTKKRTDTAMAKISPMLMIFLMGSICRLPQYCEPMMIRPSPMPMTTICRRNWIWLARDTPESASSL